MLFNIYSNGSSNEICGVARTRVNAVRVSSPWAVDTNKRQFLSALIELIGAEAATSNLLLVAPACDTVTLSIEQFSIAFIATSFANCPLLIFRFRFFVHLFVKL